MAHYYFDARFSNRSNQALRLVIDTGNPNINGNYTPVNYRLELVRLEGVGSWTNDASGGYTVNVNGTPYNTGTVPGFNLQSNSYVVINRWSKNVAHNANGTKTMVVGANAQGVNVLGNATIADRNITLSTIPRTSSFTLSDSDVNANQSTTINISRASSSFTHTIQYNFEGSGWVNIATGVATSHTWTIPYSLLSRIPSKTSGTATIRVITYNGGTQIGSATRTMTIRAGSEVVPSFTGIGHSEATSGLAANVGAYVQNLSRLNVAINGAQGVYGSTITSYQITVAGQTINAQSGATPNVINASGTVTITGKITDSRGRTYSASIPVTVLAYATPKFNSVSAVRATSGGTPADEGTYIRVNMNIAASSLVVGGTQRNALAYRISTRNKGTTSWTLKTAQTVTGVTYNGYAVVGTYPITSAHEVMVEIIDDFNTSTQILTVSTAEIFMHWAAGGLGVGKYWERGGIDVAGPINPTGGFYTQEITDWNSARATGWYMGYNASSAPQSGVWFMGEVIAHNPSWVTQTIHAFAGGDSASNTAMWRRDLNDGTWGPWYRLRVSEAELDARYAPGADTGWVAIGGLVNSFTANPSNPPMARRIGNFIYLKGQLYRSTAPGGGTTAFTLPAQFRPLETIWYMTTPFGSGSQPVGVEVNWAGNVNITCVIPRTSGVGFSIQSSGFLAT